MLRVGSSQYGSSRVQSCMNASLCNRYSLLLHRLVNCCLIFRVHFVKLVNTTNAVVCEHQSPSFNTKLASLHIFTHRCGKTSCTRALTRCVDCSWQKVLDVLQELRFCCRRITYDANVYITSKFDTVCSPFCNPTEQLKQNTLFDIKMSTNIWRN